MPDHPFHEEIFPDSQPKPSLEQFGTVSLCSVTSQLRRETGTPLAAAWRPPLSEASPQPPPLQTKQPQHPQPSLTIFVSQSLHQLPCSSLHMLKQLHVLLVEKTPKLSTVFEVRPDQCHIQGASHLPSPTGHTSSDAGLQTQPIAFFRV